jgi:hypothetical protein
VRRSGRLLVVGEDERDFGLSGELAAIVPLTFPVSRPIFDSM